MWLQSLRWLLTVVVAAGQYIVCANNYLMTVLKNIGIFLKINVISCSPGINR